jgi:hypothetical protein
MISTLRDKLCTHAGTILHLLLRKILTIVDIIVNINFSRKGKIGLHAMKSLQYSSLLIFTILIFFTVYIDHTLVNCVHLLIKI